MSEQTTSSTLTCPACQQTHSRYDLAINRDSNQPLPLCPHCGFQYQDKEYKHDINQFNELVKTERDIPRSKLTVNEVRRRLPATDLIGDDEIRLEVIELSRKAPSYFWVAPAATGDYHNKLCRKQHGLWMHTLMASTGVEHFSDSWVAQGRLSESEVDHARAAVILHDQRKRGPHTAPEESATLDHNQTMAEVVREESNLPETVAIGVEEHMGPFYEGPVAESEIGKLVHVADMAAATDGFTGKVPAPAPDELLQLGVEEIEL